MKSGWVESGRRTTLLWHLFGRRTGSYSPRQLVGRHWQLTMLQPGGQRRSTCCQPQLVRIKAEFPWEISPSWMPDMVWPLARRQHQSRVRELTRFVAGARGWQAMMQVRRRKSGGARAARGWRGQISHADVCPDFFRTADIVNFADYRHLYTAIRGIIITLAPILQEHIAVA
jgi:hypothetical protein